MGHITVNFTVLGHWKERAGPQKISWAPGLGQLPTRFPSQLLTHMFIYSIICSENTDPYCVLALLLRSGHVANVIALGLVKQRPWCPAALITSEMLWGRASRVVCCGSQVEGGGWRSSLRWGHRT